MNGGAAGSGPHDPPFHSSDGGGEFLLRLLQQQRQQQQQQQQQSAFLSHDPAVAAVGPTIHHHHQDPHRPPPNPHLFFQGFSPNNNNNNSHQTPSFFTAPHQHFDHFRQQQQLLQQQAQFQQEQHSRNHGMFGNVSFSSSTSNIGTNSNSSSVEDERFRLEKLGFQFGGFKERELGLGLGGRGINGVDLNRRIDPRVNPNPNHNPRTGNWGHGSPEQRWSGPPPGFSSNPAKQRRDFDNVGGEISGCFGELKRDGNHGIGIHEKDGSFLSVNSGNGVSRQFDHSTNGTGSSLDSGSVSDVERSLLNSDDGSGVVANGVSLDEVDDLSEQLVDSVLGELDGKNDAGAKKKHQRDKDFRSDARGKWILSQRIRNSRRMIECRRDIDWLDAPFLALYESLIPAEEEKAKQNQLLMLLEKHVRKEWPNAKLYLYGSCANSFGVSKSDIDVCLATDDLNVNKSEMLLKLAGILQSDNLQDVQALTRARVPIVKLMDPVTGISCDICINNVLAVVNTKLLRDYADIDVRLRQLAFLVKHWAKSRGVNETYQGTLSSYAYVLMCIHFLQQRNPPILPCLQNMKATYAVTVDDINCAFFDQVERLRDFGARNRESISKLLWGFFNYWAYCHDYANHVISVRTGRILRKEEKDWTRRIGNDRHLICIEDPFETSHDLGRVVDKRSIRVLREEFERAAEIMQRDPNPCVELFKPYIPC